MHSYVKTSLHLKHKSCFSNILHLANEATVAKQMNRVNSSSGIVCCLPFVWSPLQSCTSDRTFNYTGLAVFRSPLIFSELQEAFSWSRGRLYCGLSGSRPFWSSHQLHPYSNHHSSGQNNSVCSLKLTLSLLKFLRKKKCQSSLSSKLWM